MAKGKYKKNKNQEEEDDFKKKKPMITQEHLMDKSNMDYTNFVPITQADVLKPPYSFNNDTINVLKKLITDLNYLLYIDFKKFWATLLYNPSLKNCISNLLQTLSVRSLNTYNFMSEDQEMNVDWEYEKVKHMEVYDYIQAIQKVLLIIIYRMMHYKQENAQLSQIYNLGEAINNKYLFSIPKMFELIAIYGETNKKILNVIFKSYIRTVPDFYKVFIHQILPPIIKRLEQTNRQMKHLTDRQEFGINYSYKRNTQGQLSPGQEQLKRKANHLMLCIQFIQIIKGTQFLTDQVVDNIYFNHQVHFVLQNMFFQLDAAYKIWNFQQQGKRLLPMINYILYEVKEYFIQYFQRANRIIVEKSMKSNTVDAYVRSLERIFQDYGKRNSIGKKAINNRNLNLYKLVMKKFDLTTMLQKIYIEEQQNQTYQINMEYLVDFKLTLEDSIKKAEYINCNEPRQQQIQQETQAPEVPDMNDFDAQDQENKNQNQNKQKIDEKVQDLTFLKPQKEQNLQILISKKSRQDDYYLKLYKNHQKKFKADYEDEYDDLVDYDKRPLFMDDPSSDSQSQEQQKKHYVTNKDNQKINEQKHLNYELKRKQSKKQQKPKKQKYSLAKEQDLNQLSKESQKYQSNSKGYKKKYQSREENQTKKYKEKQRDVSNLNNLLQSQRIEKEYDQNGNQIKRQSDNREYRDNRDHRYKPQHNKYGQGQGDKKRYEQKGKNSNKNRDHDGGGNQKFKYRPK